MNLLEVASYDGWVLTQICQRIKFKEAIGVEPRKKNIKKGELGRCISGIATPATFIQGSAENLKNLFPDRQFDLVLCLGMLHHVSSAFDTIMNISQMSSRTLILDSMIIPELENDIERVEPFVNMRDIVYHGEKPTWSAAAFKYESPYGDGSRKDFGIVNIPTASLIEMSLCSCGFAPMITLGNESEFFDDNGQKLRGVKELLCVSIRDVSVIDIDSRWKSKATVIEEIFCHECLPDEIIYALAAELSKLGHSNIYETLCELGPDKSSCKMKEVVAAIMTCGVDESNKLYLTDNLKNINSAHLQILGVIFRSPKEKSLLEICKFLEKKGEVEAAVNYLTSITKTLGCDWWSFYRSCYLLKNAFNDLKKDTLADRYAELLSLSNDNFPL